MPPTEPPEPATPAEHPPSDPAPPAEPPAPRTPVIWTHRAERKLQTELCRCEYPHEHRRVVRADIDARLRCAFPRAASVVVLEVYLGFRPRREEYILFVDVRGDAACGTAIVKLADDTRRLDTELGAWVGCTPVCFPGNAVFMHLQARRAGDDGPLVALLYQDAQTHIGTEEVVWLEVAVLRAVRFGVPDTHTVVDAVRELFGHLGRVLYEAARVAPVETGGAIELNPRDGGTRRRLNDFFHAWDGRPEPPDPNQPPKPAEPPDLGPFRVRQQVLLAFPLDFTGYIDPIDYFRFLEAELAADGAVPGLVLPRRLRGPAHGDLHGRNVLVGTDEERAGTPALFDYENMSADNLIGLDFAKLETELKIRALDAIAADRRPAPRDRTDPGAPDRRLREFAARVQEFESRLARRTVACRESGSWPDAPDRNLTGEAAQFDRLETIVLSIREQAAAHLGARRKRFRDWLHEYYFLLGCYGVATVRFGNQNERERAAALVSAGVAVAQYESGRPGAAPIGGAP